MFRLEGQNHWTMYIIESATNAARVSGITYLAHTEPSSHEVRSAHAPSFEATFKDATSTTVTVISRTIGAENLHH